MSHGIWRDGEFTILALLDRHSGTIDGGDDSADFTVGANHGAGIENNIRLGSLIGSDRDISIIPNHPLAGL